jgi:hypothetical protein
MIQGEESMQAQITNERLTPPGGHELPPESPQLEANPLVELAEPDLAQVDDRTLLGLTELLLKDPARVDALVRNESRQAELIPRFLVIGVASFSVFALALVLLFTQADARVLPRFLAARWAAHPVAAATALWLAYALGFTAATGVCLPSFYFYGLLSGVKISVLQVTGQIMKGKAATSVMLMGILPIYVAMALGCLIFGFRDDWLKGTLYFGLALPFLAGLWGAQSIYQGFLGLADTLPPARRCRRACFLRRLTLACTGCYSAVAPVMIYTLWDYFAKAFGG